MILKRNFNLIKVWAYIRTEMYLALALSILAWFIQHFYPGSFSVPFIISAILGSALAIFIAFRNNTSYQRWWEARTAWGNIVQHSRMLARLVIANAEFAVAAGKVSRERAEAYKKTMVYRQIAFAHALRLLLRNQKNNEEFKHLLSTEEYEQVTGKINVPNLLLLRQGEQIKEGVREELLAALDPIGLEPVMAGLNNYQGMCERIKYTPLLRQYNYFTRVFLYVFIFLFPFSVMHDFGNMEVEYLIVPLSFIVAFVFVVIAKAGEINEDPFENRITDVPVTSICNTIERELKEMLGEKDLPAVTEVKDGYLF